MDKTNPDELVVDREVFLVLAEECNKVIDTRKRLPDFVFQHAFVKYFVIEYAHIHRKEFGSFLFNISNIFGDKSVNYMTLEPDAVDYYHRRSSFFGLASFEPSSLVQRYVPVMSRGGNVDSFLYRGGDVGAFWGSSLKWGISCDRISWEIAVIALSEHVDVPTISDFRCMDALWLSDHMKHQYSVTNPLIASDFTQKFLTNYPL